MLVIIFDVVFIKWFIGACFVCSLLLLSSFARLLSSNHPIPKTPLVEILITIIHASKILYVVLFRDLPLLWQFLCGLRVRLEIVLITRLGTLSFRILPLNLSVVINLRFEGRVRGTLRRRRSRHIRAFGRLLF